MGCLARSEWAACRRRQAGSEPSKTNYISPHCMITHGSLGRLLGPVCTASSLRTWFWGQWGEGVVCVLGLEGDSGKPAVDQTGELKSTCKNQQAVQFRP